MRFLKDLRTKNLFGKVCLVRVDLNIEELSPCESLRFVRAMPTLLHLISSGARVVVLSHRGRPAPSVDFKKPSRPRVKKNETLKSFVDCLARSIGARVFFDNSFNLLKISARARSLAPGSVLLLENIRFFKGEEVCDREFFHALAKTGDLFINDAFSVSHRAHASVSGVAKLLPSYAGLALQEEIKALAPFLKKLPSPSVLVLGGAKMGDKLDVLRAFFSRINTVLTGGGVANTFFVARCIPVGDSLYDVGAIKGIKDFLNAPNVLIPQDVVVHKKKILDIGDITISSYKEHIKKARTIIWSGPLGQFEQARFSRGTASLWRAVIANTRARVVVGGGDTLSSVALLGKNHRIPRSVFLSTGGGAMLEYLSGKHLPGISALG